jgi:nitronate monooxygenase
VDAVPLKPLSIGNYFRVARPILQAPIGSLATVGLAAAVSNAGGMGSLALTWTDLTVAVDRVKTLRSATSSPFFVNFALAFEPRALRPVLSAGAPAVTFSWGLPGELVKVVHGFGAAVGVQVGSLDGAKSALDDGCEFLICQGVEAGGHVQSTIPVREVLQFVVAEAGGIPVIAAGGLADGADIAEVMRLGANGAMLGTRFVASAESHAHPAYKSLLVESSGRDAVLTSCFNGDWPLAPQRVLRNPTLNEWERTGCGPPGRRPGEGEVIVRQADGQPIMRYNDTPPNAGMVGDVLSCCLYSGTGVEKIRSIMSAQALVDELCNDAAAALGRSESKTP